MAQCALRVVGIGKRYRIGLPAAGYRTLRDAIVEAVMAPLRNARRLASLSSFEDRDAGDVIWAVRDVSFEVDHGEVLGMIGSNGAGKSTLLKILSRIVEPTTGYANVHGRVGSLLEVGTGFHPELTGRENVYLNGSILGMGRREINRRFDAIVAFAEVERFLDTPVKRYSIGMYLRLAFAVAAHLDPEILFVDEVLAVGDAAFQQKCLGKMRDVATSGRTVVFVSHSMDAIQRLCTRCILLEHGRIAALGPTASVVTQYLADHPDRATPGIWIDVSSAPRNGTGEARFIALRYTSRNDSLAGHAYPNGPLEFTLVIDSAAKRRVESLAITLSTRSGTKLVNADTIAQAHTVQLWRGRTLVTLHIKELHLNPGVYVIGLWLSDAMGVVFDRAETASEIDVLPTPAQGLGAKPGADGLVPCNFEIVDVHPAAGHDERESWSAPTRTANSGDVVELREPYPSRPPARPGGQPSPAEGRHAEG